MNQLEVLRNKLKSWGGALKGITHDYAGGQVVMTITKDGQTYQFAYKGKNATDAVNVLAWSIRTLINCDERGILPFKKTAKEFLLLTGSPGEPFVEADEVHFETLGLTSKASNEEVIKAFKAMAKNLHPDTFAGHDENFKRDAEKVFAKKSEAYNEIKKARRF
jgi:hypothetical protein